MPRPWIERTRVLGLAALACKTFCHIPTPLRRTPQKPSRPDSRRERRSLRKQESQRRKAESLRRKEEAKREALEQKRRQKEEEEERRAAAERAKQNRKREKEEARRASKKAKSGRRGGQDGDAAGDADPAVGKPAPLQRGGGQWLPHGSGADVAAAVAPLFPWKASLSHCRLNPPIFTLQSTAALAIAASVVGRGANCLWPCQNL